MTRRVTVGAIQLVADRGTKETNLQAIEDLGAAAASDGALVVVAPEMAVTGYCWPDEAEVRALAEPLDGPSVQRLTRLARLTGAWYVVGLPEVDRDLGTLHNTCVLVGPDGLQGTYRKIHPFIADPFWAVDGNVAPPVWSTPAGGVAAVIWAAVDYTGPPRYAALTGADWLAVPTAWVDEPAPSATWRIRAWENALPVVAADMAGDELGIQFSGGTGVLDHCGNPLASVDVGAGYVTATLDLDAAAAVRRPLLAARRPTEYRSLALSKRWPRRAAESLFGAPPNAERVTAAVLCAQPGQTPAVPEGVEVAVLPAFHLCGGAPSDRSEAEAAADAWPTALTRLSALADRHGCEVVTSLVERADDGRLHHTVVAVGAHGEVVRRRATHLGRHESWATPGEDRPATFARPWGRLGLLVGEELEPFEPSRVLALHDADLIAVPAAVSWPLPVAFGGTQVPLGDELQAPERHFAHPARLRAGDSHVWVAFANAGPAPSPQAVGGTPGGIFAPDHVTVPRRERVAVADGWATYTCETRATTELGAVCESKPQLVRRRPDLFAERLIAPADV